MPARRVHTLNRYCTFKLPAIRAQQGPRRLGTLQCCTTVSDRQPRTATPTCPVCVVVQMKRSSVVGNNGSSDIQEYRTSYGTFVRWGAGEVGGGEEVLVTGGSWGGMFLWQQNVLGGLWD